MIATLIALLTCKKPEKDRQLPPSSDIPIEKSKSLECQTNANVEPVAAVTPELSLSSSKEETTMSPQQKKQQLSEDAHGNVEASHVPHVDSDIAVGDAVVLQEQIMSKASDVPSVRSVCDDTAAKATEIIEKKGSGLTVEIPPVDDEEDEPAATPAVGPDDMMQDLPLVNISKTKSRDSVKSNASSKHDISKSSDSATAKVAEIIPATSVHSTKTSGELQGVLLNGGSSGAKKVMSSGSLKHPDDEYDVPESRPDAKFDEKHIDAVIVDSNVKTPSTEESGSYFFCCA
mmetsp:Transcript_24001/g.36987  ORF Transcript_24001/g.36987 Transcript_24001/m.36987 type:complete len:288 (+) Transcript_24001:975-1838(+)|eukprot:CAMPEP_0196816728 /NCGR_PEP_ID=MMETSP1362-20130617/56888_1 /TAXON_ID=163516 /ORGANISM="Leptocylindrus danicus, Strain CCMP1856" /LENGTH=287 /DNA_ID=CAMNT_0042194177 /DNA_START=720 /DNA_END=1583 /DNA_ORIENTATION=-